VEHPFAGWVPKSKRATGGVDRREQTYGTRSQTYSTRPTADAEGRPNGTGGRSAVLRRTKGASVCARVGSRAENTWSRPEGAGLADRCSLIPRFAYQPFALNPIQQAT